MKPNPTPEGAACPWPRLRDLSKLDADAVPEIAATARRVVRQTGRNPRSNEDPMKLTLTLEHNGRTATRTMEEPVLKTQQVIRVAQQMVEECEQPSMGEVAYTASINRFGPRCDWDDIPYSAQRLWEELAQDIIAESKRRESK